MTGAEAFRLGPAALQDIRVSLRARILEGLTHDGREIRALPAFVGCPPRGLTGSALVVDVGGTNLRAAQVRLTDQGAVVEKGPVSARLDAREGAGGRDDFFGQHAAIVAELAPDPGLPLGYCFSYPSEVLPDGDARLLGWTKGIAVAGVVGERVGALLREALANRGIPTSSVFVLNDTVAALLAGAGQVAVTAQAVPERTIGLIVGTGTNMAAYFDATTLTKLGAGLAGPLAVNLESGAFHPPHLTAVDDKLALSAAPVGGQRFEKAVSGHYLPLLFAEAGGRPADEHDAPSSASVVDAAQGQGPEAPLAAALLARSAELVGAGLAAVGDLLPGEGPIAVLAEGGLYWNAPGYDDRVRATLAALAPERPTHVLRGEEANLVGAATAALLHRAAKES